MCLNANNDLTDFLLFKPFSPFHSRCRKLPGGLHNIPQLFNNTLYTDPLGALTLVIY